MQADGFLPAIRTKREQPSMAWKVASMMRRTEASVGNELGWCFQSVCRFFPRRGLKTVPPFGNISIKIGGRLLSRTVVCQARNAVDRSMGLTAFSAALRPLRGKCCSADLEHVYWEQSILAVVFSPAGNGKTHADATVAISLLAEHGTAGGGGVLSRELRSWPEPLPAIPEEKAIL